MHRLVSAGGRTVYTMLDMADARKVEGRAFSLGSHGYVQFCPPGSGKVVLLHRWLLGAVKGDGLIVDHINRIKLDNRRINLRFVTPSESSTNTTPWGISGYRGVYPMRDKWQAKGKFDGKQYYLGTFATAEEAAQVAHDWRIDRLPGYEES